MTDLVEIENLHVSFRNEDGGINEAVRGVSLSLGREKLGIVGESGSGKSLTGRALLGVLPPYARVSVDRLSFDGIDRVFLEHEGGYLLARHACDAVVRDWFGSAALTVRWR